MRERDQAPRRALRFSTNRASRVTQFQNPWSFSWICWLVTYGPRRRQIASTIIIAARGKSTSGKTLLKSRVADHQASVDRNDRAGDVRSGRKAEAERDVSNFFRIAVAPQGGPAFCKNRLGLFGNRVGQRRANRSGADAIDRDSFRAEIH